MVEDAEMFTEGPHNTASSGQVNRDIVRLAAASLLMAELHIARLIGGPAFATIAKWMAPDARESPGAGTRRLADTPSPSSRAASCWYGLA
jgi:hypothetical protein